MSGFFVSSKSNKTSFTKKVSFLKNRGNIVNGAVYTDDSLTMISSSFTGQTLYSDGKYSIVGDCNIVNIAELKPYIESQTHPDTTKYEMLVLLYQKYGTDMLLKLNGSFSFVLYDSIKHVIFGARDRLGEKPFFYNLDSSGIECSTTLKSICAGNRFDINDNAKKMYLKYGFIYDSECIFDGICKLPTGHYFIYDLISHRINISKYWDIDGTGFHSYPGITTESEAINYIDNLLESAIGLRVPNTDKCGLGISSGTDSFAIFGYLNDKGYTPNLFTIASSERKKYDEYPEALAHVHAINLDAEINKILLTSEDLLLGVDDYFKYYDEPNSDLSEIITDSLFHNMALRDIHTALSGMGSDLIFYAFPLYQKYIKDNNIKEYVKSYSNLDFYCKQSLHDIVDNHSFRELLDDSDVLSMQRFSIKTYLPNLLIKEDIASTGNNVEVLNPFCDYRIFEFLCTLGAGMIYKDNQLKYLLKTLLMKKYNVDFFNSPKKGFFPDLKRIYDIPSIKDDILHTLSESNIQKYLPEMSYFRINRALDDYDVIDKDNALLNLYFYIKLMLIYEHDVFN